MLFCLSLYIKICWGHLTPTRC